MRGKQDKRKLTERSRAASGREGIELVANYKARGFIFLHWVFLSHSAALPLNSC